MNGYYWPSKRVWKKVESQGKVSEKSGNFDMDNEWQPCNLGLTQPPIHLLHSRTSWICFMQIVSNIMLLPYTCTEGTTYFCSLQIVPFLMYFVCTDILLYVTKIVHVCGFDC